MRTESQSLVRYFYGLEEDSEPDLRENFEAFVTHLERRRDRAEPVTVIIDGRETGVGKSSLAIEISRRLDPNFGLANLAYRAADLYDAYERLPAGSAAIYDESVLGLLSRRGSRDDEMAGLIGALSIVRKNGIATILCIPKLLMLDTIVYSGLAPHWIFIEKKGRGRVHRAHKGAHYRKSQSRVPYDLWEEVSPLTWRNLDRDPFFRAYKEQAVERNRAYFHEQRQISEVKRRRQLGLPRAEGETLPEGNVPEREVTGGGGVGALACQWCGREFDNGHNLRAHAGACRARPETKG